MMRLLLVLSLLLPVSILSLTSCTSGGGSSTEDEIEDVDSADADFDDSDPDAIEDSGEETEQATNDSGDEDALESELGEETSSDEVAEAPQDAAEDSIEDDLAAEEPAEPAVEDAPVVSESVPDLPAEEPAAPAAPAVVAKTNKVTDIRYVTNSGGGTIVIETSEPVAYQTRISPETQQFVIELADVNLPAALRRPYSLKEFGSQFGSINAYQGQGSNTARVVVQLAHSPNRAPIVQQEGTSLIVIPSAAPLKVDAPAMAATTPADDAPDIETAAKNAQQALAAKSLSEFLTGNQKFFGRPISLQVKDADIRDLINFLAEESGANIVMSDEVTGRLSLKLRKIPWDQALVTIMRMKDLGYIRQGNVLRISKLEKLSKENDDAAKMALNQTQMIPMVVQVIPVNYAILDEVKKNLEPFLSKDGRVVVDGRTNTVIITDRPEVIARSLKLVKTMDIAPAQVSIESKIVEAVEEFSSFVGVNWGFNGTPIHLSPAGGAEGAPIDMNLGISSATTSNSFAGGNPFNASLTLGTLDILGDLTASLALAERDSLAKVISSPRISTMNREKATITQSGENISIISSRSDNSPTISKAATRVPFALELSVTPQITNDGGVIIDLDVKRQFLGATVDAELQARPINTRSAKSKILVRNGQTAVIGGIYTSDETEGNTGVPGLKNLPVVGWLFKSKAFERSKNELLIFLTPRILAQDNINQTASR